MLYEEMKKDFWVDECICTCNSQEECGETEDGGINNCSSDLLRFHVNFFLLCPEDILETDCKRQKEKDSQTEKKIGNYSYSSGLFTAVVVLILKSSYLFSLVFSFFHFV